VGVDSAAGGSEEVVDWGVEDSVGEMQLEFLPFFGHK
jgi:hypothetical protein